MANLTMDSLEDVGIKIVKWMWIKEPTIETTETKEE